MIINSLSFKLEKMKKIKDSIFFITGDHGEGWDKMRLKELKKDFGFRTYSELLTIPFCNFTV